MSECPYCLSPISDDDKAVQCTHCGAYHHTECWHENGGCAAKDCGKRDKSGSINIEVEDEPHTLLVLSKESVEQARPRVIRRKSNPCMKCGRQLPDGELYCVDCTPPIEENQDTKNAGPLLMMIGIGALVIFWIWWSTSGARPISNLFSDANSRHSSHIRQ